MYELHCSTLRNYCTRCGKFYDVDFIANSTGVPAASSAAASSSRMWCCMKKGWTRRCCPAR